MRGEGGEGELKLKAKMKSIAGCIDSCMLVTFEKGGDPPFQLGWCDSVLIVAPPKDEC